MDHIPLQKSVQWLEKSEGNVNLLESFFADRVKLEESMEEMWKDFACKWQGKFTNLEDDPLFQYRNGSKSLVDILRILAKEPDDNATICRSVKSLLQCNCRNSPTALLNRWTSTDAANDSSIEEYKIAYITAVESMSESETQVLKARRILKEKKNKEMAASYRRAVDAFTKEKTSFCETMMDLQSFLEGNAKSQMEVVKESLNRYMYVINEYDEQRKSRKERMLMAKMELTQFSVEKTVEHCLSDMKEPIMLPEYKSNIQIIPPKVHWPAKFKFLQPVNPYELYTIIEEKENTQVEKEEALEVQGEETVIEQEEAEEILVKMEKEALEEQEEEAPMEQEEAPEKGEQIPVEKQEQAPVVEEEEAILKSDANRDGTITYYSVESHNSVLPGHLSFSAGQKIVQHSPADGQGLAYGYILKRTWPWSRKPKQKKYGLYPAEKVAEKPPKISFIRRFMKCMT